ncbi:hypothetical protein C0993_004401 [Termitomyces sp. T159_Od127]|nr:hypothetical protein C0993_004401 [Termitomyces sp. T159_Od127]
MTKFFFRGDKDVGERFSISQDEATRPAQDTAETTIAPVLEKLRQSERKLLIRRCDLASDLARITASLEPQPLTRPAHPLPAPAPVESLLNIEGDERPVSTCSDPIALVGESGSEENPIIVETKPLKPSRSHKPSAAKPLAPLFAPRRTKTAPVSSPPRSPEIVLLELPDEAAKPKLAPIFAPRPSKTHDLVAPFPTRETQHVRGPQHAFTASSIPYTRLVKHASSSTLASYKAGSLKQFLDAEPPCQISTTSIAYNKDTYLDTIPDEHREHPAISRMTAAQPEASAHRLWVDKWRPTRAAEVLGNEDNATYLRDWIRALELQLATNEEIPAKGKGKAKESSRGTKRPRVVREVEKRRGRKKRRVDSEDEDDSWIVYDEEYFSSPAPSSPVSRSSPPLELEHDSVPHTFTSLTNTILLTGPTGSGKTAAVYACAEELGWDVLEVYPGIGRRNGAGIDSLIGDAGKNHHVRQARTGISSDICGKHFVKRGKESTPNGDEGLGPPSVRQSLILLEEVDILFKDDTNFWPAVTNFIKGCRRPVICTCNDISLVPTQDLPLQAILTFQACAPQLAASYLQALCFQEEQHLLSREALVGIYEDSAAEVGEIDLPDIPNPATSGDFPSADLRRAINGLQIGASGKSGWEDGEVSADHAELVSYVDTYLRRGPWDTQEGAAWGSCEASQDDEAGHTVLFWARAAAGDRETAAEWVSRGVGSAWMGPRELFRARVDHQSATGEAFEGTVPLPVLATRRREVGLDYGSRIREMVAAEDAWERVHGAGRTGRATRNSGAYGRSVAVSAQGRAALGRTALGAASPHGPPQEQREQGRAATAVAAAAGAAAVPAEPAAGVDHGPVDACDEAEHGVPGGGAAQLGVVGDVVGAAGGAGGVAVRVWGGDGGDADADAAARWVGPGWVDGAEQAAGVKDEGDAGFDYGMRRHSIALGTKRKMGEEVLAGPGVPSEEGPAPKRRGSAVDTARIAQLSLNERRHSVDSRASWWLGDRRDSTSSFSSAVTGADSPQGRPTPPFAWPTDMAQPPDTPRLLRERPPDDPAPPRTKDPNTPYSRSPELRVSHKLAERKRRKEMKDLFDELRDQLPADRGMKASKWEILSKGMSSLFLSIEFVVHLKQSHQEMARELDMLRHELDATRQGLSFYAQPAQFPPGPVPPRLPHPRPPSAEDIVP